MKSTLMAQSANFRRLSADHICFAYHQEKPILTDISVSFCAGEWLTLLGPNGTGKTTLMRCILQQITPQRGTVMIDDIPVKKLSPKERAARIAYVPQSVRIPFSMPVMDTVLTGRLAFSPYRYSKYDYDIVSNIIEKMHLQELAFRPVNELSGGERQRVWIARALAQEATLLCMDEPMTGMDPENTLRLLELIRDLTDRGEIGVLMTLHDLNLAGMYSDRIALLYQTKMYAQGSPQTVLTEKSIWEVYHVDSEVSLREGIPQVRLLRKK